MFHGNKIQRRNRRHTLAQAIGGFGEAAGAEAFRIERIDQQGVARRFGAYLPGFNRPQFGHGGDFLECIGRRAKSGGGWKYPFPATC